MEHIFNEGATEDASTLLLLHGTGGTEEDLLPLAEMIDDSAAVLSVRGNVSENGMPRFFRRLAEGVFDEEDLLYRTKELNDFVNQSAVDYDFDRHQVIAVGYSNGANIAASLLYHHEQSLAGAVLFHPMVPRRDVTLPDLTGLPVFIGAGKNDPICQPEETQALADALREAGASVTMHWGEGGHQLTKQELTQATAWYRKLSNPSS